MRRPRQHLSEAPFITHSVPVRPRRHLLPDTALSYLPRGGDPRWEPERRSGNASLPQTGRQLRTWERRARGLCILADETAQKRVGLWLLKFNNVGDCVRGPGLPAAAVHTEPGPPARLTQPGPRGRTTQGLVSGALPAAGCHLAPKVTSREELEERHEDACSRPSSRPAHSKRPREWHAAPATALETALSPALGPRF